MKWNERMKKQQKSSKNLSKIWKYLNSKFCDVRLLFMIISCNRKAYNFKNPTQQTY